ncbi:MAG TPA: BadF/BadG/BcrA/BcrD ATPase family protein [Ktedonobacterales bacterium]
MRFVVGVDGGGTKTAAAVVGDDLREIGTGAAGPSNYRSVGMEAASQGILEAIERALAAANITLDDVAAICMCLSGFDTELDLPVPQRAVTLLGFTGAVIFENDVVGAWGGVTGGDPGIVAIAGTGATALGMNDKGELWRVDGWDYILGDAGSGYRIGLDGIHAAMKMLDGRMAPSRLLTKLASFYGVDDALGMRRLADSGTLGKLHVADFSRHVAEAAAEGDATAQAILRQAADDIAADVEAIVNRLNMRDIAFPIGAVGSVFKSTEYVLQPLLARLAQIAPRAAFSAPRYPPEVGAAVVARRRLAAGDLGSWTLGGGQRRILRSFQVSQLKIG